MSLHVTDPSLNVTDLSVFLKNIAGSEPKSSDLRRSEQNRRRSKWNMANRRRIWTEEACIWSGDRAGRVAAVLEEKTRHSTRRDRVWRVETRHRPPESSDRAGSSVWSGKRVTWTPRMTETRQSYCNQILSWDLSLFFLSMDSCSWSKATTRTHGTYI